MTPRDTVNELADGLRVSRHGGDGTWSWWVVVPTTGGPATHVAQGPFSLVVTGDLACACVEAVRRFQVSAEKTHGPNGPAPFAEVHPRTDKIDRAIVDMRDSNLARMALPALYLSTGRYMPDEAKRAREVLSGFCDAAGKPTPKADATHVGWSLVA